MLLGGGKGAGKGSGMLFFGTVPESIDYFTSVGFPPPEVYTPTDVFLQVTDAEFGTHREIDFEGSFACSVYSKKLLHFLQEVERSGMHRALNKHHQSMDYAPVLIDEEQGTSSDWKVVKVRPHSLTDSPNEDFVNNDHEHMIVSRYYLYWTQYKTLLSREFVLAARDPSLYYLQIFLVLGFGFLIGASFFQLRYDINVQMNYPAGGLLWIVMMCCYIQIFKVYHLSRANWRFKHEACNSSYNFIVYWFAELSATMILLISFIPGTAIAYFMMGLPSKAFPFLIFLFWMTALTAESMLNFVTKFSENATISIVSSQALMVILTVFGGGMFIAWNQCPNYWKWLQEISIFTQASRSAFMNVNDYLDYSCSVASDGNCYGPLGNIFPCDASLPNVDGVCKVSGRMVLHVLQGTILNESKWIPFGYLVLIFFCFRLSSLFLMYYPVEKILYWSQDWWNGISSREILENQLGLRRIEGQLNAFLALHYNPVMEQRIERDMMEIKEQTQSTRTSSKRELEALEFITTVLSQEKMVQSLPANLQNSSCLEWKNVTVTLKKKKQTLIHQVSGVALPGRILALMGPSGAGKTTLLNALSNRTPYAHVTGEINFGKRPFTAQDLIYVPQFDEFNNSMTVKETIQFIGLMKCINQVEMFVRLTKLLRILGLAEKAHHSCKKLTSGELKRVSVGMGMISNPNVLFLDEPTTGLDSTAAYSIVEYLSQLSKEMNVVVIMTIHQPAQMVFDLLQDLYLLENGSTAYFGPSNQTSTYFEHLGFICPVAINPIDFYLDLMNHPPESIENNTSQDLSHWSELYGSSCLSQNMVLMMQSAIECSKTAAESPLPPPYSQRWVFLLGYFSRYYSREFNFYYLRFVELILIALFLGTLFLNLSNQLTILPQYSGALFFNIWTVLFSAVAATGLLAADRRQAIEQVKNAIFLPSMYCLSQFLISIPFNFIAAVFFQSIFHWLTNINPHGEAFIYAIVITCGHLLLMEAIMLTVVQVLRNAMLSVTFAMVVMGYLFLFSGFFILISDMPPWISWISYITPTMYSFHGYLWQIFQNQDFFDSSNEITTGTEILNSVFDIQEINAWGMFGVLIAWIVFFRIIHYSVFLWEVYPYLADSKLRTATVK